jgi:hypothetical protein
MDSPAYDVLSNESSETERELVRSFIVKNILKNNYIASRE